MLMSLNGKAPQLFPFQRGEGGSIPSVSIQGKPTSEFIRKEEALLTRVSSIALIVRNDVKLHIHHLSLVK